MGFSIEELESMLATGNETGKDGKILPEGFYSIATRATERAERIAADVCWTHNYITKQHGASDGGLNAVIRQKVWAYWESKYNEQCTNKSMDTLETPPQDRKKAWEVESLYQ